MPTITPIIPEGTITIQRSTQMPSQQIASQAAIQALSTPAVTSSQSESSPQATTELSSGKGAPGSEPLGEQKPEDQKKLRALLYRERQIFNERKKLEADRKSFEEQRAHYKNWIEAGEMSSQNKLEALAKTGITYEDLTQQILNNGQIPPAQIAELKAQEIVQRRLEEYEKKQKDAQEASIKSQHAQSLKQIESEIRYVVDKSDKYPLVKEAESYQDIVKEIEAEFHRTGRIIPVEEAIQRWESDALEGLRELAKLEKIRSNVFQEPPQPTQERIIPNTLSQRATAPIPAPKSLTEAERRQRAIDVFYGRRQA